MSQAADETGSWLLTAASIQAALLAELVAALHEAGALPDAAVTQLASRWQAIFADWKGGASKLRMYQSIMAQDLAAEMAWRLPSLAPSTPSNPVRVGRSRRWRPSSPAGKK